MSDKTDQSDIFDPPKGVMEFSKPSYEAIATAVPRELVVAFDEEIKLVGVTKSRAIRSLIEAFIRQQRAARARAAA